MTDETEIPQSLEEDFSSIEMSVSLIPGAYDITHHQKENSLTYRVSLDDVQQHCRPLRESDETHVSRWRIADALKMRTDDPTTTIPVIPYNFPVMSNDVMIWDTGQLLTTDGVPVTYRGWKVIWTLAVMKTDLTNADIYTEWLNRNNSAFVGYWYAREGTDDWIFGGRWFERSADQVGLPWEWSGGPVLREGTENVIDFFFTAVGPYGDTVRSVISHTSGQIFADEKGVWFTGFDVSTPMFEADGINYADASQNPYFNFRDPHFFYNDEDGYHYVLFEGNVAGMRGSFTIGTDELGHIPPGYTPSDQGKWATAAIGIARLAEGAYEKGDFSRSQWTMLPPLITAVGVNDQTERPHLVVKDGRHYILSISHHSTSQMSPNNQPDGVLGWVSEAGLFGPYKPMNGSGLVAGNPSVAPLQTYSHYCTLNPHDNRIYVQGFINYLPDPSVNWEDAYNPSKYRIGGTLAPTIVLEFIGDQSYVVAEQNYAQLATYAEWSTDPDGVWDTRPETIDTSKALMQVHVPIPEHK